MNHSFAMKEPLIIFDQLMKIVIKKDFCDKWPCVSLLFII